MRQTLFRGTYIANNVPLPIPRTKYGRSPCRLSELRNACSGRTFTSLIAHTFERIRESWRMADLNWNSRNLTHGWQKGVTAFTTASALTTRFNRAQIGIGALPDGNLCNVHAYELAKQIAQGCKDAGLIGLPFGTPAVSDNITQGQEGGNASLPSRNMIANGAEAVVSAHSYDGIFGLHNCDKNGPGFAMALARLNYPGLIVSGGSIMPGCHNDQDITILDVYDSQAALSVGATTQEDADHILRNACPGAGGCGIAASFNTWGICMEAIGLMLPPSSSILAIVDEKRTECLQVGQALRHLLEHDIRPRDILTRQAFTNAAVAMAAAGGSTNGILHLLRWPVRRRSTLAKGHSAILRNTPVLCSFAPRGKRTMVDLHHLGGTPVLLKHLLAAGLIDGSVLTVTGKTMAENVADVADVPADQDLIAPLDQPFKEYADMQICFGNLAPGGMVFKVSSMEDTQFKGQAICFDEAKDIVDAVEARKIQPGSVIVLRN